eukprot:900312-Prorocentrum_minimum.AAC.1
MCSWHSKRNIQRAKRTCYNDLRPDVCRCFGRPEVPFSLGAPTGSHTTTLPPPAGEISQLSVLPATALPLASAVVSRTALPLASAVVSWTAFPLASAVVSWTALPLASAV